MAGEEDSKDWKDMITVKNLYDIVGKKMANETSKSIVRNNMPPQIAEQM